MNGKMNLLWSPQKGPQQALIKCPLPIIFFGGARGGGKTDGVLGKWLLKERRYGSAFNGIMFRRTTVSSEDAIERAKELYKPLGADFNESKLFFRMPNGGRVSFKYLDSVKDADEWQGRNVTDVWIEEAGQYPDAKPIDRLFGVMRSASGVPVQMVLTANPGGAGQHWIRQRFELFPFPKFPKIVKKELSNGEAIDMACIPSRITDNKILLASDPKYIDRLHLVGSAELVRAWLEGDWSAIDGAFFDCWSTRNVIEPFEIPDDWLRFRSGDWGYAAPFSIGWWAVAGEDYRVRVSKPAAMGEGRASNVDGNEYGSTYIPRGSLVRYREWYGCNGNPNEGLRLTAEEVAQGIKKREAGEKITYGVMDPAAFAQDGGPSIAERMSKEGVAWRRADNKRVSSRGALSGWDQMRSRIKGDEFGPRLFVFDTCKDFIRTVPVLQHDPDKPEDLDTDSEDHVADEARYGCSSRPWIPKPPKPPKPQEVIYEVKEDGRVVSNMGIREIVEARMRRKRLEGR